MAIDVFNVGVNIAMSTNGPQVIGTLLRDLGGLGRAATAVEKNFAALKVAAVGALGVLAGSAAIKGLWGIVEAGRELNRELERTKQLGGDFAKNIDRTRGIAFQTSFDVPTVTPSQAVRLQRELGGVIGNDVDAGTALPYAARMAHVVSNYTGENEEDVIKNLIKFADIRAKIFTASTDGKEHIDFEKLLPEMEAAAKSLIIGGNYVKSGDLLALAKQAGVPIKGMAGGDTIATLVEMAISQGGSRTGTAITSLMQQLVGGTMTVKTATNMTRAGLLHDEDWYTDHGKVVVRPSGMNRNADAERDPIAWITGRGKEMIDRYAQQAGISEVAAVYQLFGRQTTQRLVAEGLQVGPQFARAREFFGQVPGMGDQFKELQAKDLDTNITGFKNAWTGLMQALSDAGTAGAISILHGLTDGIHYLTAAAAAHPGAVRILLETAAGFAALVAVGGALAVTAAALSPFAAGIRAVASVAGLGSAGAALTGVAGGLRALMGAVAAFSVGVEGGRALGGLASGFDANHPWAAKLDEWGARQFRGIASGLGLVGKPTDTSLPDSYYASHGLPNPHPDRTDGKRLNYVPPWVQSGPQPGSTADNPLHVRGDVAVTNPGDIERGVTAAQTRQLGRPSTGTTNGDPRMTPDYGLLGVGP
jgi:hypothetical protein